MENQQKKSVKKPIVIRQTKASIYRLAKSNPLLVEQNKITVDDKNIFLPPAVLGRRLTIDDIEFAKLCKENAAKSLDIGKKSIDSCVKQLGAVSYNSLHPPSKIAKSDNKAPSTSNGEVNKFKKPAEKLKSKLQLNVPHDRISFNSQNLVTSTPMIPKQNIPKTLENGKKSSNLNIKRTVPNGLTVSSKVTKQEKENNAVLKAKNVANVENIKPQFKKPTEKVKINPKILTTNPARVKNKIENGINVKKQTKENCETSKNDKVTKPSTITTNKTSNQVLKEKNSLDIKENNIVAKPSDVEFKKPLEKKPKRTSTLRRSLSTQHLQSFVDHRQSFYSSTPVQKPLADSVFNRLQQPLKEWLQRKNKSLSNFHHLKCFGLQHLSEEAKEEIKENIDVGFPRSPSYEDLKIPQNLEEQEKKDKAAFAQNLANGAVEDIYQLLIAGYYPEQCEAWLNFIREKYKAVDEQPQYWECRAEIEQKRGNITSAIEAYKNSIINGANVEHIDESLGQLLDKFSVLQIEANSSPKSESNRKQKEEVRNIFKSTIIQFAIEKRSQKEKNFTSPEKEKSRTMFIATPVRRSTRKSCGKFQNTPGKNLVNSLNDLDDSIRENLRFESNSYLA